MKVSSNLIFVSANEREFRSEAGKRLAHVVNLQDDSMNIQTFYTSDPVVIGAAADHLMGDNVTCEFNLYRGKDGWRVSLTNII